MPAFKSIVILFVLLPFCACAQKIPEIWVGNGTNRYPIAKRTFFEKIKVDTFEKYPQIHISSDDGEYEILYYTISLLPKRGDLFGPQHVSGKNAQDMLHSDAIKHYRWASRLRPGDQIIVERIGATLTNNEKTRKQTFRAFTIILE